MSKKEPLYPHVPKSQRKNACDSAAPVSSDITLYHGTTRDRAKAIMEQGLGPAREEPNLTTIFSAAWNFGLYRASQKLPLLPGEPPRGSYFGPREKERSIQKERLAEPNTAVIEFVLSGSEMDEFGCSLGSTLAGCVKWLRVPRMRIITSKEHV